MSNGQYLLSYADQSTVSFFEQFIFTSGTAPAALETKPGSFRPAYVLR